MNKLDREALEQYGVLGWDRRSYAARLADAFSQLARWNNTAARYEPITLNTLADAADDSAAATAGVAVGGLYRTGSTLKTRIA